MKNISSFLSKLYDDFGSRQMNGNYRNIVDLFDKDNDLFLCQEFIDLNDFESVELLKVLSVALITDGQRDKADWLGEEISRRESEKPQEVFFFWLNPRVKMEISSMTQAQRKTLSSIVSSIERNSELLRGNYSNVGFVIKGNEYLRDMKKHGSNGGFRVYFTLLPDKKSCVILGLSKGKSTTDVPKEEIDKFAAMAEQNQNLEPSDLEAVKIITESIVGIYVPKSKVPFGVLDQLRYGTNSTKMFECVIDGNDYFAFYNDNVGQKEIVEKNKELTNNPKRKECKSDFLSWFYNKVFSNGKLNIRKNDVAGFFIR